MISLDIKHEVSSSSPLGVVTSKEDAPTLSFSELLKGIGKKDDKVIQNGALVLSLVNDEKDLKSTKITGKGNALLALLKNESTKIDEPLALEALEKIVEPVELNPKITAKLTIQEVKTLVLDAKEYLKTKILQSDTYKKSEIKDLPKTLKGLANLAKKVGIDVSKITLEEVQVKTSTDVVKTPIAKVALPTKEETPVAKVALPTKEKTPVAKVALPTKEETPVAKVALPTKEETPVAKVALPTKEKTPVARVALPTKEKTPVARVALPTKEETPVARVALPTKEETPVAKVALPTKDEVKKDKISENLDEVAPAKMDDKKIETPKEIKSTPLFKAQANREHTTEQLVQTKQFKVEEKTPKTRADETLKLLLMGEKPSQNSLNLTADFSVATAKVIAPSATTDASKALSKLLHGKENETASKTDGLSTLKADSFEVKLNEAKHMIKYLSTDVKAAIEDYKSPFTRIKIQLNPQKLGEVDLTIVQRGKNLHVSLSSNSAAINTLAMNATELKAQLNNSGINNATLNFNNSSENSSSNQQQGQRQHEREAHEEYNHFDNETENEEVLSSLEIVVPRYI